MIRNLRELWQYRALLWNLTQRELKARYRGSAL
jgi:lipopolysaccharide transport system permease protein